ncbi:hypothetical protein Drorol1_Dr00019656, partial [Drosera rotundifolia]
MLLRHSLGVILDIEIWVMKDWNSMEWAKERAILAQSLWAFVPNVFMQTSSAFNYLPMEICPLGFTADGRKLLLRLDGYGKLISYDLDSQSLAEVRFEFASSTAVHRIPPGKPSNRILNWTEPAQQPDSSIPPLSLYILLLQLIVSGCFLMRSMLETIRCPLLMLI